MSDEPRDATTAFARAMVDEWARGGITDACIAPGSRSTPLALALADDGRLRLHVHLDERSASFFALGIARASRRPVALLCTSGTAAANFHPAVLEAHHGGVALIVCTADRPPELHHVGAGQTVDQTRLFGPAVRWFADPGPPLDVPGAGATWRALAARAAAVAAGPPAGPVHLNLAFREPLVPTGAPLVPAPGRPDGAPWAVVRAPGRRAEAPELVDVAGQLVAAERGLIVAGWGADDVSAAALTALARALGWPVLADPISGLRAGGVCVSSYDALLREPAFAAAHRPDLVLRVGAPTTGRTLNTFLAEVPEIVIDPDGRWLDPPRRAVTWLRAEAAATIATLARELDREAPSAWLDEWLTAERAARRALDAFLDSDDVPFEGRVARDVVAGLPSGATLVVGSSMPVRDVESFAAPRAGVRFVANRGVNGIDGFVSTVLGVASAMGAMGAAGGGPVVGLTGDLGFLHDTNGLLGAVRRGIDAVFVIVDNGGGGIFEFLPQRDAAPEHFELLFGTPGDVAPADVARLHGLDVTEIDRAGDVVPALEKAIAAGGVHAVVVHTDRATNVARHRDAWRSLGT